MRGGSNGGRSGGGHNSGGYNNGGGSHHNSGQSGGRRVNPRVQTFDSNGPDVRIRGTAYQINEKYVTLARDATSAGDRVLAESYLQHAEHYQRFINEMTEEFNQYNQQNPQPQPQPMQIDGNAAAPVVTTPQVDGLNDLDQGFLVGPRHGNGHANGHGNGSAQPQPVADGNGATVQHNGAAVTHTGAAAQHNGSGEQPREEGQQQPRGRHYSPRRTEPDAV